MEKSDMGKDFEKWKYLKELWKTMKKSYYNIVSTSLDYLCTLITLLKIDT